MSRGGYDVVVTDDHRVIVDGLDCTSEIDAKLTGEQMHYIAPTVN